MIMRMNRLLPLILLLVISRSATAEDAFLVLGSFVNEDVARAEGSRISNDAGIEVLLFESIVNTRVQYRLLTGQLVEQSSRSALREQLMSAGVSDPWLLRFDDGTPYMETVFSDLGTGDALSATELAEIDSMLSDFDEEYAADSGMLLMDTGPSAEDVAFEVSSTSLDTSSNYVVVGSYGTARNATDYARWFEGLFPEILLHEVTVLRSEVSGATVFRVMIGPVVSSEEEKGVMDALSEQGIRGAWLLRGIPATIDASAQEQTQDMNSKQSADQGLELNQDISQPQRGFRIPGQSGSKAGRIAGKVPAKSSYPQGDFNPVRLRKAPANFPDPRDKH